MSDVNPTRRTDEPPARDGAPLAGWPTTITTEEAVALRGALKQLQTALDAVVRERDEARAEVERLRAKDTKTRHALKGWVWVCPDGGDEPTHERVAAVVVEVEWLRAERDTLLLGVRDFVRWFNRNHPDPTSNPDHPWCAINSRLNAHADVLETFDSGIETKEAKP